MDAARFDALARSLMEPGSRRGALIGFLGGALGSLGLADAAARKGKKHAGDRRKGGGTHPRPDDNRETKPHAGTVDAEKKKACPPCKKRKKGKCKGRLPDGTACSGGTCQSGSCVAATLPPPLPPPPCHLDEIRCGTGCCPNADAICRSWACVDNQCVPTDAPETTPCGAPDGCEGDTFQAPGFCDGLGTCAQPVPEVCSDDGNPCTVNFCDDLGGCGAIPQQPNVPCGDNRVCCEGTCCPVGTTCLNNVCSCGARGTVCDPRFGTCCSGTCTALFLDPNNCGACGRNCGSTNAAGCCSGTCTYFGQSPNCGGCGRTCSASQSCFGGVFGAGPFRCCGNRNTTCMFNSDCCTEMCESGRCL